jgi:hypothetical protein
MSVHHMLFLQNCKSQKCYVYRNDLVEEGTPQLLVSSNFKNEAEDVPLILPGLVSSADYSNHS